MPDRSRGPARRKTSCGLNLLWYTLTTELGILIDIISSTLVSLTSTQHEMRWTVIQVAETGLRLSTSWEIHATRFERIYITLESSSARKS